MRYLSSLYVDEKSNKILHRKHLFPKKGRVFTLPLLCIYFPECGSRMEFTEVKNLNVPYFHHHKPLVIGFASDEKAAKNMLLWIIDDTYRTGNETRYRDYLEKRYDTVNRFKEVKDFIFVRDYIDSEEKDREYNAGKGK